MHVHIFYTMATQPAYIAPQELHPASPPHGALCCGPSRAGESYMSELDVECVNTSSIYGLLLIY